MRGEFGQWHKWNHDESLDRHLLEYSFHSESGQGNMGGLEAAAIPFHDRPWSLNSTLPPLSVVFLKNERGKQ
jgi:1,4-alpha-glucan branching enzyme